MSMLVIYKVNYKMDKAAWITIISYLIVFFLLIIERFVFSGTTDTTDIIWRFIMFIVYVLHAYFIFVMKDVYNKLTCDSQIEYIKRIKREKIVKIVISILLVFYLSAVSAKLFF